MKKKITKVFSLIIAIILSLSVLFSFGCDSGVLEGNNTGGNNNSIGDGGLGDFILKPENVSNITYNNADNYYTQNSKEAELTSAIDEVYSSVVYMEVTVPDGSKTATSFGCGVIVDITVNGENAPNSCYVYTCFHVVEDYISINLAIPYVPTYTESGVVKKDYANIDYTKYTFTTSGTNPTVAFIGGDKETDLAVLRLDLSKYSDLTVTKAPIGEINSSGYLTRPYSLGQTVFVIGNPSGLLKGTTSSGIISSVNRTITVSGVGTIQVLQIDAPASPGNSGGGVFNLYGELIGILNAGNESYENIAFAIPVTLSSPTKIYNKAKDTGFRNVIDQLISTAWSDGDGNFNYGYIEGKWKFGVIVAYARVSGLQTISTFPYVNEVERYSSFYGKLPVGEYIVGMKYFNDGTPVEQFFSTTSPDDAKTGFETMYYEMKEVLTVGDSVTIYTRPNSVTDTTTTETTVTLKQYIYYDTGMYQS